MMGRLGGRGLEIFRPELRSGGRWRSLSRSVFDFVVFIIFLNVEFEILIDEGCLIEKILIYCRGCNLLADAD